MLKTCQGETYNDQVRLRCRESIALGRAVVDQAARGVSWMKKMRCWPPGYFLEKPGYIDRPPHTSRAGQEDTMMHVFALLVAQWVAEAVAC